MMLLQTTWLEILLFNMAFRSAPTRGEILVFADDFRHTEADSAKYGTPTELNTISRRLAKKMAELSITREEYMLMKAILLLNPGEPGMWNVFYWITNLTKKKI